MERTFHYEPPKIGDLKSKNPVSTEKYTISVITPLFGGGVVAGENDKKMLIRPMSIRGQLRFWWRATRGKTFSSVSEMRKAEQNIWGSTDTPSKVNVTVKITKKGNSVAYADVKPKDIRDNRDNKLPYVLFPFQENRREGKTAKSGTVNIEFELQCSFPKELEKDVEAAVWAWVNFGGIGARTRRGCGALYCEKLAPKNADGLKQWFNGALQQYGIPQQSAAQAREWSTLGHTFYYGQSGTDALAAWNSLANVYRSFRQDNIGRNGQQGRSFWTEPDTIRTITNQCLPKHQKHFPLDAPRDVFPRAEFGLPIVFEFTGQDKKYPSNKYVDPIKTELHPNYKLSNGKNAERMNSPLIIKPLMLQDNKTVVPIVLLLDSKRIDRVVLNKSGNGDSFPVHSAKAAQYQNSPMRNRSATGSALEAFLTYCKEQHYTEIK